VTVAINRFRQRCTAARHGAGRGCEGGAMLSAGDVRTPEGEISPLRVDEARSSPAS
jgi:hypothetical protein